MTTELWLALLILYGYGYFYNAHNWNHISRFDAIFSFVEPDTADQYSFRIDHFLVNPILGRNTGDWSQSPMPGRHYYSNKAPGLSLIGVPLYWGLYRAESAVGAVPESHRWTRINTYLLNLLLTVLPTMFAAVAFFRLLQSSLGLRPRESLALTFVLFFATALLPYGTQLWGHTSAAAFAVISLYFLLGKSTSSAAAGGFAIGLAVLSEYSAAITLASYLVFLGFAGNAARFRAFLFGGVPPLMTFVVYHKLVFGQWFTLASFFNNPKFQDLDKWGGIFGEFSSEALLGLSVSPHHGLFFFMPVLLLAIPGLAMWWSSGDRKWAILATINILGFALMNLSFNGWHGGACLGPRYLIPSLPFYGLALVPLVRTNRGIEARVSFSRQVLQTFGFLWLLISLAMMSLLALRAPSTTPMVEGARNPVGVYFSDLLRGDWTDMNLSALRLGGAWNIDGHEVVARNGRVDLGQFDLASSFVRARSAGPARFLIGWKGSLEFRFNGVAEELGNHDQFEVVAVRREFRGDGNRVEVRLERGAPDRSFTFYAFESYGRSRMPRAFAQSPEPKLSSTNLGHQLGLKGTAAFLPWLAGVGFLFSLLWRRCGVGR